MIDETYRGCSIIHGDALHIISQFPPGLFGGIITDPPYASGGATQNEKQKSTGKKYSSTKGDCPFPDFEGDSKDQRSWTHWMAEWLQDARRACKPGAPICLFIDWRQAPSLTDALQWAGWIWRGTAVWDKVNARPQKGRIRQQAEFIVWGSNGPMDLNRAAPVLPGVYRESMPAAVKRQHQTEKPLGILRQLVHIVEPGEIILDPFAGAGTTIVAAHLEGYSAIGIEMSDHYAKVSQVRLEQALAA